VFLLEVTQEILDNAREYLWCLEKMVKAKDETVEVLPDRQRIGKIFNTSFWFHEGVVLILIYHDGEKVGKIIQHSPIVSIEMQGESVKVCTANTALTFRLVGKAD
jgi:hypothetical protein